ncbi:non-hydrolyzing UDP-N-acetylglucosamine 2-epimerase [Rhodohalobacter sp. 8-1]|uniref:non-hydrolyzing UDP-N-acetylglucosamine 2-epimerase n=1 Tax=Rhodohalobacter sp. 8-1 TaxID=3131972 RepID=UPI0030EE624B
MKKDTKRLKVVTVVGTRPEIIRLSRVIPLLDDYLNQVIVHTGQNYDYELNEIFFNDLELRKPDYFLEADRSSMGAAVGDILKKTEIVLKKEEPDAMLVLGDTNSCLSAYIAKRLHIPVFHMEAGNRSYDFNVPEEVNRRIIDHIADFNLVYTEHARRHLISEGLPHRRIYLTGSPMKEVLDYYRPGIEKSTILSELELKKREYFLVSTHREENVDNPDNLKKILGVLERLNNEFKVPVIVSTHPRTRKKIEELGRVKTKADIRFLKPFGFLDYNRLQLDSLCTLSDSGTISEESSILSFPAVSIRESMERPEAQDAGTVILSGFDPDIILQAVRLSVDKQARGSIVEDYNIENTSMRVLKLILGNTGLSNRWHGINF